MLANNHSNEQVEPLLFRYEIHVPGLPSKGAYSGITYDENSLAAACEQSGLTVEDYEQAIDDSEDWHLSYPDLPDGEYLFYFTPKGRDLYLSSMIHIEGLAAAIYAEGSFENVQIPYREGAVYEDDLQVAYLKD
jgi:hypothetical protein